MKVKARWFKYPFRCGMFYEVSGLPETRECVRWPSKKAIDTISPLRWITTYNAFCELFTPTEMNNIEWKDVYKVLSLINKIKREHGNGKTIEETRSRELEDAASRRIGQHLEAAQNLPPTEEYGI